MCTWVRDKSFLCLNATDKSEMMAYLCNDLLSNKAVVQQIDANVENIAKCKRQKWDAEIKVKKFKTIQARRAKEESAAALLLSQSNNDTANQDLTKDESMSAPATASATPMESETASEVASLAEMADKEDDEKSIAESEAATNDMSKAGKAKKGRPKKGEKAGAKAGKKRKADDHEAEPEPAVSAATKEEEEQDEDEKLSPEVKPYFFVLVGPLYPCK